ncbi:MAG: hypothetical protein FWE37_07710 [Spirochaetaceae bacterium]|nr:hypothetical protein [Spirochaetaceae bacterium]
MKQEVEYTKLSKMIREGLLFAEASRTYLAGENKDGTTKGLIVASEGLFFSEDDIALWLNAARKLVIDILGENHELAKPVSHSFKEEIIRLLKARSSLN